MDWIWWLLGLLAAVLLSRATWRGRDSALDDLRHREADQNAVRLVTDVRREAAERRAKGDAS